MSNTSPGICSITFISRDYEIKQLVVFLFKSKSRHMAKYSVNLSRIAAGTMQGWSGTVVKQREPSTLHRNTLSTDETILRNNKAQALADINEKLAQHNVNFTDDEVIWTNTQRRLTSQMELTNELNAVV